MDINISKITVQLTNATDKVYVKTDLPCPFVKDAIPSQPPLDFYFDTTRDTGIEYVKKVFGIEPEIINSRYSPNRPFLGPIGDIDV
jgi:hypothetical protein